ncbi:MAG: hypothetical protein SVR04_00160 [Spirochaetota bacterium]|nr:hypothetical protein [Spirochaetota bacterium]
MAGEKNRQVMFSLLSAAEKAEIAEYAAEKGFLNIGSLARFALYQYMTRCPARGARCSTARAKSDKNGEGVESGK